MNYGKILYPLALLLLVWTSRLSAQAPDITWEKTHGGEGGEFICAVDEASGGYIIAGYTNSYGAGGYDAYLIKLGYDPTGVHDWGDRPMTAPLALQCHPNPFNPVTTIRYWTPRACHIKLSVYDVSGKRLEILTDSRHPAGEYIIPWHATGNSSGVYFVRLETPKRTTPPDASVPSHRTV